MERLRVAALQYYIRPVRSFDEFAAQVTSLVATAKDYRAGLVVFPEYFSTQLLTLGDLDRPIDQQIRNLACQSPRIVELMSGLARKHGVYIVGGTVPVLGDQIMSPACEVTDGEAVAPEAEGRGDGRSLHNDAVLYGPSGQFAVQGKLHMTRFEKEEWLVSPRDRLRIFETDFGRIAIAICYDVEFPEIARAAARQGAHVLIVPSCTDDRRGFCRVRYCAHARAIENHMYVVHSPTVGSLPMVPAVSLNYGQASILTPSDFAFPRDGILAEGNPNEETIVIADLDFGSIMEARTFGTVLPLNDSERTGELIADPEILLV